MTLFPGSGASSVDVGDAWEGPIIVIYDSAYCDSDNAGECALVTLDCDDQHGRGLGISIDGLELEELVQWMTTEAKAPSGMRLDVSGLKAEGVPHLGQITVNDMDGTWSVTFYAPFSSDPGLTIDADRLDFKSLLRRVTIDLEPENRARLEDFVGFCSRE
jgi:hypothetical protein